MIAVSVYAESMELFSLTISLTAELAKLVRTLVADGMRFMTLIVRSRTALGWTSEPWMMATLIIECSTTLGLSGDQ